MKKQSGRGVKSGCQHPYHAFGAKEMAAKRKENQVAAMEEANLMYRDPREAMSSEALRQEFNEITGKS